MKRIVASRKLKRRCDCCNRGFSKGDIYYHERTVWAWSQDVYAYNNTYCPKCHYKIINHQARYEAFKQKCDHRNPKFIVEVYGENEPLYDICKLCGNKFW